MAEIESVLDHMVHRELRNASNHATRATIKLRVLLKLMHILDIPLQSVYDTKNLIQVDVTCSREIESIWLRIFDDQHYSHLENVNSASTTQSNTTTSASASLPPQPTSDETCLLEKFLAKDFVRSNDLAKLVTILVKKYHAQRYIWHIFAVDGLYPSSSCSSKMDDFKKYYDHLAIPLEDRNKAQTGSILEDQQDENSIHYWRREHVFAVRAIYNRVRNAHPNAIAKVLRKLFQMDGNRSQGGCNTFTTIKEMSDPESDMSNSLEDIGTTVKNNHPDENCTVASSSSSSDIESSCLSNENESNGMEVPSTPVEEEEQEENPVQEVTMNIPKEQQEQDDGGQQMKALEHKIECCYRFAIPDKKKLRAIAEWKRKELAQCERIRLGKRNKGGDTKQKMVKKMKRATEEENNNPEVEVEMKLEEEKKDLGEQDKTQKQPPQQQVDSKENKIQKKKVKTDKEGGAVAASVPSQGVESKPQQKTTKDGGKPKTVVKKQQKTVKKATVENEEAKDINMLSERLNSH